MTNRQKMGTIFLGAYCLAGAAVAQIDVPEGGIMLPEIPGRVAPPVRDDEQERQELLDRKRMLREKREKKFQPPPTNPINERNKSLLEEMLKTRELRINLGVNLAYAHIITGGPRENYVLEPTTIVYGLYRWNNVQPVSEYQMWYGFRLASFNGTGLYEGIAGRFGFLYFGPMVGVGKIDPVPASLGRDATKKGSDPKNFLVTRGSTFFTFGVSLQSRFATIDRGTAAPSNDLNEKGAAYDAPGLWGEATYSWVHFGAVGINLVSGFQLGTGKTILYVGGGFSGFY